MKIKNGFPAILFLAISVIATVLVCTVDVQAIGPMGTKVGFAGVNGEFHDTVGVHMVLYNLTEALGIGAIVIVFGFAVIGLIELLKTKSLMKVDKDIIAIGVVFVVMLLLYVLFEKCIINYRPIIMPGEDMPEASFPSSHTMLICTVCGSAIVYIRNKISNLEKSDVKTVRICNITVIVLWAVLVSAVLGRLFCGAHWLTDIVVGALYAATLVAFYKTVVNVGK